MSVWASFAIFDGDEDYPRPLRYRQSHVLPGPDDERGGALDLACIPGFITRGGRDDGPEDDDQVWPYLRVHVTEADDVEGATVVLDRQQVAQWHDELGIWLERSRSTRGTPAECPPCARPGCGHTAWCHGDQSGHPTAVDPCHAAVPGCDCQECPCEGYEHPQGTPGPEGSGTAYPPNGVSSPHGGNEGQQSASGSDGTPAGSTPEPTAKQWADLANDIHATIAAAVGGCHDTGDSGLCHDIADAVVEAGWRP